MDGASARRGAGMNDPTIRVALGCGNQAALGVAEVSIRDRGFLAEREEGAGGFATTGRAGAALAAAAGGDGFFAGAGRGAAAREVRGLAAFAAFLARGLTRLLEAAVVLDLDVLAVFVGLCFPTDFFLDVAAADERPAFFPFAAGIATPFPFLAVVERGAQYTNAR